ncbi:hypothetical protein [Escherichia coli]|uniref:hypothetical protein n=1 Tax=Escherichia coli TaxID=562 RepID=UPI0010919875|nr:hypothetical protein [Escherichia coli]QBZ35891.1 hypothetical protein E5M00_26440 [Escherichia coli]
MRILSDPFDGKTKEQVEALVKTGDVEMPAYGGRTGNRGEDAETRRVAALIKSKQHVDPKSEGYDADAEGRQSGIS